MKEYAHIPKTDATTSKELPKVPVAATTPPQQSKVALRNKSTEKPSTSPSKKTVFRQSGSGTESPIPKRAKFIKKFRTSKASSHDKKKPIKTSKTKLTAEGGKAKQAEQKTKKSTTGPPPELKASSKQRKESTEQKPRQKKVSKTKKKQKAEQTQEMPNRKSISSEPQTKQMEHNEVVHEHLKSQPNSNLQNPPSSFEVVADSLAEMLVKEAIAMQGINTW